MKSLTNSPLLYIKKAHQNLKYQWSIVLLVYFIFYLSGYAISFLNIHNIFLLCFANILISASLTIGIRSFNLSIAQSKKVSVLQVFDYLHSFFKTLSLMLAITTFTLVGFFLFIIPGIVVFLNYSQVYYIMAQNPKKGIFMIMNESVEMMKGHRLEYLNLSLVFFPLLLLSIFCYGLPMLIIGPYFGIASAHFYLEKSKLYYNQSKQSDHAEN